MIGLLSPGLDCVGAPACMLIDKRQSCIECMRLKLKTHCVAEALGALDNMQ